MERFYVVESTGYISLADRHLGTEFMIIDRDYCSRVIRRTVVGHRSRPERLGRVRERFAAFCRAYNEEDSRGQV